MKMSKSLGNTISPIDLMRDYGADILRLWALSVDFTEDHRIGKEILAGVGDQYRKLRNTFRYLLGALEGFEESERIAVEEMPELERYMLALTSRIDAELRQAVNDYDFNGYVRALTDFCNDDLSAFFFDIRKDSLYCDAPCDPKRRAYRTVLDTLFHALVRWAAPVLVFTSEEVWGTRYPDSGSVHLLEWPQIDTAWRSIELTTRWRVLRRAREKVSEAIEPFRRDKVLGSSLEAAVELDFLSPAQLGADVSQHGFTDIKYFEGMNERDWAEILISSDVALVKEYNEPDHVTPIVRISRATNHKCGRCWRLLPEVAEDGDLCARCDEVVNA
jgi:isoleucyl-tRNA synthetase